MPFEYQGIGSEGSATDAKSGEDPGERWGHVLIGPNIVLMAYALYTATQMNQFFPHDKMRSAWWPWATCFRREEQYALCSQFLVDEYSFTHFSHGFVIWFWIFAMPIRYGLGLCFPQRFGQHASSSRFDWLGFHVSAFVEIIWELWENTPGAIEAFRQSGPNSANYAGDSGMNMLGDIMACQLGFVMIEIVRMHFKWKGALGVSAAYAVIMTVVLYYWICDGLIIIWVNIIRPGTITCSEAP